MSNDRSITRWIADVKQGDDPASKALWQEYFTRLVQVVRQRLDARTRRVCDEEDIAISVFESFFRAAEAGRFPDLNDRDDLWRLLLSMALRKTVDQRRRQRRMKRGNGKVRGESAFEVSPGEIAVGLEQFASDEPTPAVAAQVVEEFNRLLAKLSTDEYREIAIAKLEGYTNSEIAAQMRCSTTTVERRLKLIRVKWSSETRHP